MMIVENRFIPFVVHGFGTLVGHRRREHERAVDALQLSLAAQLHYPHF